MAVTQWEYAEINAVELSKTVNVKFSHQQSRSGSVWQMLKQLGDEGWEMVGVGFAPGMETTGVTFAPYPGRGEWRYVFKRPLV